MFVRSDVTPNFQDAFIVRTVTATLLVYSVCTLHLIVSYQRKKYYSKNSEMQNYINDNDDDDDDMNGLLRMDSMRMDPNDSNLDPNEKLTENEDSGKVGSGSLGVPLVVGVGLGVIIFFMLS